MQHPGGEVSREAVPVLQPVSVGLALPAVGAIPPGFLAGVAARPLRPVQRGEPVVDQLSLAAPALEGRRGQLRAAGGAGEQVHHQACGVVARVADHVRQCSAQLGAVLDQLPLQPGFSGHEIEQLHHTGGVARLIPAPAGARHRFMPEAGAVRGVGAPLAQGPRVANPGHQKLLPQARSALRRQRVDRLLQPLLQGPVRAVERHHSQGGQWRD